MSHGKPVLSDCRQKVSRSWAVPGTTTRALSLNQMRRYINEIGFEKDPARCDSCQDFVRREGVTHHCGKHHIKVREHSICNDWIGHDGETLDAS